MPEKTYRKFPIQTETACQLKWTWSTIFLTTGRTSSCHRTNNHPFDTDIFDFHNTPTKLKDRQRMLKGQWPEQGCNYCRDIEEAGGQSDRITNLDFPGISAPPELDHDPHAIKVTPRILEVYFDNICNLKCVYCRPLFSSLWDAENKKHGFFKSNGLVISDKFTKDPDLEKNKIKMFKWLEENRQHLTNFNILGGEPLFQEEFDQCLDFFDRSPAPDLSLQIFTNLNTTVERLSKAVTKVKSLVNNKKIKEFCVTASLDCWGEEQEYARFPLDLKVWEKNFEILLENEWIKIVIGSTLTPLTIKTFPDLVERINHWNKLRPVYHYFNSVNDPSYMKIDVLGNIFIDDFQRALDLITDDDHDRQHVKNYLRGIAQQSANNGVNHQEAIKLRTFLDEMDRRRNTNWRRTFPYLVKPLENAQVDQ